MQQGRGAGQVFSHARNLPAVVHCTHGKDRTGLLVALLLLLLGVSQKAVVRDYVLSEKELKVPPPSPPHTRPPVPAPSIAVTGATTQSSMHPCH